MKKWFKNLLLIIAVIFSINTTIAQTNITIGNGSYNSWALSNTACYGCGSFYTMIVNNPNPIDGYYYYDIYLWSNSYYTNGYAANTYVKPINIYTLDPFGKSKLVLTFAYVVVPPKSASFNGYFYLGYVYSTSAMQKIKLTWSNVSAW